jgi:hypothetical protein
MSEPRGFIHMKEIARVEAFWWVGGKDGPPGTMEGDWMGIVYRPIGGAAELMIKYRFRYYEDDLVFHSEDRKSSYEAKVERSRLAEVIVAMDEMATMMLGQFGGKIYRKRFVHGTPANFQRWIVTQPFSHTQSHSQFNRTRPQ